MKALVRVGAMLIAVGGLAAMIPRPAAPPVTHAEPLLESAA